MKKTSILDSDKVVAQAIDNESGETDNLIHLSTGVVLEARQANPHVLIRVMTAQERPQPPVSFVQAMGREMENPDDPDYIKRVEAWEMAYNNSMLNALVGLGTTLKSLPKGMEGPHPKVVPFTKCGSCGTENDSEKQLCVKCDAPLPEQIRENLSWVKEYQAYGLPVHPEIEAWRYITWVLFKAAVKESDTALIGQKVKDLSGVREANVQKAVTFPGSDETDR